MGPMIGLIIILIVWGCCKVSTEAKVKAKNSLDIDNTKMTKDICNGVFESEINRRYGNRYYDKK